MHISCVIDENVCKIAKNGDLKMQIYGSKNISSCSTGPNSHFGIAIIGMITILWKMSIVVLIITGTGSLKFVVFCTLH